MDTKIISALLKKLDAQREVLKILLDEESLLSLNGHQEQIGVRIGTSGRQIAITHLDRSTGWAVRLLRGKEMILLGVKKAYAVMIEEARSEINKTKAEISASVK